MQLGWKEIHLLLLPLSAVSLKVPMCARSWHNSCASFVSCAESDMVHRDLSPDKMCQCHTLPFVAGVYLKGAQSFWRPLWPRLTCEFLWEFTCTRGTCVEMQVTFSESRLAKVWQKQEAHTRTGSVLWQDTASASLSSSFDTKCSFYCFRWKVLFSVNAAMWTVPPVARQPKRRQQVVLPCLWIALKSIAKV